MNDKGVLYIVATPIGNLDDISFRAISILKAVHVVAAEDTRHSLRLFNHFGIDTKLIAYHDHSSDKQVERLLRHLDEGSDIALVSDAGTPLISDPGYRIVKIAREQGVKVVPVPGPSAPIVALSAAGLATDRFSFEGFLPHKSGARIKSFEAIKANAGTSVFFESPHRIADAIKDAVAVLGAERSAVMARELTKTFETFIGPDLQHIQQAIADDANQSRGEIVLLIGPLPTAPKGENVSVSADALKVATVLAAELPTKQAAALASNITGESKKKLYELILTIKAEAK